MRDKVKTVRSGDPPRSHEDLPYVIEVVHAEASQVLARASSSPLAREIFKAAKAEHPEHRIVLRKGERIVADSSG
jgi:hypothetical protein